MPDFHRIARLLQESPWALDPSALARLARFVRAEGAPVHSEEFPYRPSFGREIHGQEGADLASPQAFTVPLEGADPAGESSTQGGRVIAVLPLVGVVNQRSLGNDFLDRVFGIVALEKWMKRFQGFLNDPSVAAIVLDVDSPGGSVPGVQEAADQIFLARGKKPVVAVANSLAASAAYWLSSQASELVVTPSGEVGSIGVYALHLDWSEALKQAGIKPTFIKAGKYKAEGNPYEPLTDEAKEAIQEKVDHAYSDFVKAISRARGAAPATVRSGFGQGRTVTAKAAVEAGMADRVESLDATLKRLGSPRGLAALRGASAADSSALPSGQAPDSGSGAGSEAPAEGAPRSESGAAAPASPMDGMDLETRRRRIRNAAR